MAKPALIVAGALLVGAGGGAVGYALTRDAKGGMSEQGAQAARAALDGLDGDIKAARAGVRERAASVAGYPAIQSAIATDKATVRDMVDRGELKFEAQPHETIALVQLENGKPPTTLLVLPDGASYAGGATKPGGMIETAGERALVTEVAQVTPRERAGELSGLVVVSRELDPAAAIDKLVKAGVVGRVEIGGKPLKTFGAAAAGAVDQAMPLPSQPDVQIVVAVPPAAKAVPMPLAAGGGAAGLVGLVLVIVGLVRKAPLATTAGTPAFGTADTKLSLPGTAAGTPAPGGTLGGGAALSTKPIDTGASIGRWEVVRRLGSGGMADVYLARARGEAGFEKLVAIKVMHPHLARNPRAIDHFLDEAKLAARITHPNVVAIQDLGKIGDDYVIVMEYVDGVDLERLLMAARTAQRPVPLDVGLGILCRICDGLNGAHRATAADGTPLHLVHRDVKAANVLVSKQGGVKVVDFGIAKAAQQSHLTVAGETKGTPSMMAPEQRVGETVDVRADVYSVAAVGYEIVTGHGVNLDLAALAHLGVDNWPHLPAPSSLRAGLPVELDAILLGAMAFERTRRPADCAALEASLEAVMKANGLVATDKDIARWVQSEVALLPAAPAIEPTLSPANV